MSKNTKNQNIKKNNGDVKAEKKSNVKKTKTVKKIDHEIKKNTNNHKIQTEENQVVKKFVIILLVVIAIVVLIYFMTRIFVTKDLFNKDNDETQTQEVDFNYDITILGSAFNRPYDEYYIITYKGTSDEAIYLSSVINKYLEKEDALKIYYADLDEFMNKDFYDPENVNKRAANASELKVGDYTLILFRNGKISKYIEGKDAIADELAVEETN